MIIIKIENTSDMSEKVTAVFDIKGKDNAIAEFTAVLNALEKTDRMIFAFALLTFLKVKEARNDKE